MFQRLGVTELDEAVAKWAAANVAARHVGPLKVVTHLGGTEVAVTAGITAGLIARVKRQSWRPALELAVVIVGQNLAHNLVKRLSNRSRPRGPHHSFFSGTSFPSGHTTTAAAAWPAIAAAAAHENSFARTASLAIGPMVGSTRVLLGVHWLSDVIAGLVLGWGWLAGTRAAFRRIRLGSSRG